MALSRNKTRTRNINKRSKKRVSSKKRFRGGNGEKILINTLCKQANDQTLNKVPELKGIVNGICDTDGDNSNNNNNNNSNNNTASVSPSNSILDTAGGFLESTGATNVASKAIKGFGSVATLPMRIAFGALGKITGFNPFDKSLNNNSNDNSSNSSNNNSADQLQGGNIEKGNISKLVEKLNTIDKRYLGPEIVEELKNFGQSGGSRKTRKSRKRNKKIRKSRNNKKSLKKRNMKGGVCKSYCMSRSGGSDNGGCGPEKEPGDCGSTMCTGKTPVCCRKKNCQQNPSN